MSEQKQGIRQQTIIPNMTKEIRAKLHEVGNISGKRLFYIACDNIDLKYNEKLERGNGDIIPRSPFVKYYIVPVDIVAHKPVMVGDQIFIRLNGNEKLQFPLMKKDPEYRSPFTEELFEKAISIARSCSGDPILFGECDRVYAEVAALNSIVKKQIDNFATEMLMQADVLKQLGENLETDRTLYLKQIGVIN